RALHHDRRRRRRLRHCHTRLLAGYSRSAALAQLSVPPALFYAIFRPAAAQLSVPPVGEDSAGSKPSPLDQNSQVTSICPSSMLSVISSAVKPLRMSRILSREQEHSSRTPVPG